MFISKSKKGLKPKAPARRGTQATPVDDAPRESTPVSRHVEPTVEEPQIESADVPTEPTAPALEKEIAIEHNEPVPVAQDRDATAPASVTLVEENADTSRKTRSPRRGRTLTPPPIQAAVEEPDAQQGNFIRTQQAESTTQVAETDNTIPLSPPPTQAPVTAGIRKGRKAIKPRAQTKRQTQNTEEEDTEAQPEIETTQPVEDTAVVSGTNRAAVGAEAETDDVSHRLRAALAEEGLGPEVTGTEQVAEPIQETTPATKAKAPRKKATKRNDAAVLDSQIDPSITGVVSAPEETVSAVPKPSRKRKQPAIETPENDENAESGPTKKRKPSKPRAKSRATTEPRAEDIANTATVEINTDDEVDGETKPKSRKRKRAGTPEDAESREIAPDQTTMAALTVDNRQGKVSVRETRLRDRDVELKERKLLLAQAKARGELEEFMANPENSTVTTGAPSRLAAAAAAVSALPTRSPSPDTPAAAPRFRIVNGQIVADESSRIIDRRAERTRAAEANDDDATVIEEDDLSRRVNSRSFAKYDKPSRWTEEATQLFYLGLQYFGLEFSMMACLFPGRSRRQLKAKFIREERIDVHRVNALLRDRKPAPSKEELEEMMGKKLKDPGELQRELAAQRERLEEDQRAADLTAESRRLEREREAEREGQRIKDREGEGDGQGKEQDDDEDAEEEEVEQDLEADEEEAEAEAEEAEEEEEEEEAVDEI